MQRPTPRRKSFSSISRTLLSPSAFTGRGRCSEAGAAAAAPAALLLPRPGCPLLVTAATCLQTKVGFPLAVRGEALAWAGGRAAVADAPTPGRRRWRQVEAWRQLGEGRLRNAQATLRSVCRCCRPAPEALTAPAPSRRVAAPPAAQLVYIVISGPGTTEKGLWKCCKR